MVSRKRTRWSKAQLAQLDQQIVEALEKSHPQSVRHIFYLMTNPRLPRPVEKSEEGYKRVQRQCVGLRRAGRVPYDRIVDMTRRATTHRRTTVRRRSSGVTHAPTASTPGPRPTTAWRSGRSPGASPA